MTAVDQSGRTVAAGETYLLAGIVRRIEAANRVAIVTGSGERRALLRVDPAQLLRVDDLIVSDGSRSFSQAPLVNDSPKADGSAANKLYVDTEIAAVVDAVSALFQPIDATLTALAGLTTTADRVPYFTATDTAAVATLTSFGRSLIDDANAAAARTTLGLTSIATLAGGAKGDLAYFNGTSWSVLPIGTAGQVLTVSASLDLEWV